MNTLLSILFIVLVVFVIGIYVVLWKFISTINKKNTTIPPQQPLTTSFDECNDIINTVINEVYTNKYLLYYTIKEITMIPKMDEEIKKITTEVYSSFSETMLTSILQYYSKEYLIKLITRRVQLLLVDYIDKHKPNVG